MPFVKHSKTTKSRLVGIESSNGPGGGCLGSNQANGGGYVIGIEVMNQDEGMEGFGRLFQEFYLDLEEELGRRRWRHGFGRVGIHSSTSHQHHHQQPFHHNGSAGPSSESTSSDEKVEGFGFGSEDIRKKRGFDVALCITNSLESAVEYPPVCSALLLV